MNFKELADIDSNLATSKDPEITLTDTANHDSALMLAYPSPEAMKDFDPDEVEVEEEPEESPLDVLYDRNFSELDAKILKICGDIVIKGRDISELIPCPRLAESKNEAAAY